MSLVAAVLTAAALAFGRPPGRWWVRRRLGVGADRRPVGAVAVVVVLAVVVGVDALPSLAAPVVATASVGAAVGAFCLQQVRSGAAVARLARRRATVAEALGLLAAELRAGVIPQRALSGLADDFPALRAAARAAEVGGDVAVALHGSSSTAGHEALRDLAAAWQVSDRSGAPLADVIDRLEQSARVDREVAREIESGVAPARATARLMAVLPVLGLGLGSGLGGDPVAVLTTTWTGVGCLATGSLLACSGVAWIERIAATGAQA